MLYSAALFYALTDAEKAIVTLLEALTIGPTMDPRIHNKICRAILSIDEDEPDVLGDKGRNFVQQLERKDKLGMVLVQELY